MYLSTQLVTNAGFPDSWEVTAADVGVCVRDDISAVCECIFACEAAGKSCVCVCLCVCVSMSE